MHIFVDQNFTPDLLSPLHLFNTKVVKTLILKVAFMIKYEHISLLSSNLL
jgi:hypothetical protein